LETERRRSYGSCTVGELAGYWRVHRSEAPRIAKKLGLEPVAGRYPWAAVWRAMGLAPPAPGFVDELKRPLMTLEEVARERRESVGAFRRKLREKRFPELPCRTLGPRIRRFHPRQVLAWCDGDEVPCYPTRPQVQTPPQPNANRTPPDRAPEAGGKTDIFGAPVA
jgi:hypothetical protein